MSGIVYFPSGGGNTSELYEGIGAGSDGSGTTITTGAGNTAGAYASGQLSAATAAAWSGFDVTFTSANSSANRYLVSISVDGGSTTLVANLYVQPHAVTSSSIGVVRYSFPLQVAAGANIMVKAQSQNATQTLKCNMVGWVTGATNPPGFTTCTQLLAPDTTNTRASSTSVAITTDATTWTQLVASTAATYGAFLVALSDNGVAPGTVQICRSRLGVGAAASEVTARGFQFGVGTSGALCPRAASPLIEQSIASTSRLSMNIQAAVADATLMPQVMAFS
jgi:hypothetical protein